MKLILRGFVPLMVLAACAGGGEGTVDSAAFRGAAASLNCGVATSPAPGALSSNGIGALRVGATINDLRSQCTIVGDTIIPGPEGTRERRVTFLIAGDSVSATVDGDNVWRIEVDSPRFRTSDSLGVGSRARDLKRGSGEIATGEGNVAALRRDHCGLSFLMTGASSRATWTTLPDSARVRRVLIIGCAPEPPEN